MEEPEESIDGDSYGFDNCVERYTKPHPVNQNYAAADVTNLEKDLNHVASIRYRLGIDHWGKFVIRFLNEVMVDRYYGFIRLYIDIGKNSYSNIFRKFDLYIVGLHDGINLYELGLIKELKEGERLNRWIDTAYLTDYKESYKDLLGRSDLTGTKLSFQVLRNAARQVINNPGKPNEWKQNFAIFALLVSESARFVWLFVVLWFKMDTYRSMNLDGQYDWGAWLPHNWITLADCSLRTTIPATKPQHEPYTLAGAEELLLYPKLAEGALGARPWHGPHPPEGKGGPGDGGSGLKRAFARDRAKGPGVGGIRRRSRRRQRRYHGPHPPEGDGEDGDDRAVQVNNETSAKVIDGKRVAKDIRKEVAVEISRMKDESGIIPGLAVILVGDRKDSATYVRKKKKACDSVGINSYEVRLAEDSTEEEVLRHISEFNNDPSVHGILVQLPLPSHMNEQNVLNSVCIEKDVDGFHFHPLNIGRLAMRGRDPLFVPCTPKGCIELLHRYDIPIKGKRAVVIGRSNIVGMPAALLLQREDATVSIVHSRTKNPDEITRQADIIISAVGQANMVRGSWVKPGAVLIDVGINPVEDAESPRGYRLVGDICYEEASKVASAITPVPGGVGPMTIAMLLSNTLLSAKRIHNFR